MRSVVGAIKNDGVVGNPQLIELVQQAPHQIVVTHHGIVIETLARQPLFLFGRVGPEMHASGVKPHKERLVLFGGALNKLLGAVEKFEIHRLHALFIKRPRIRHAAVGEAMHHTARTKTLPKGGVLRVVRILRLLFGVEVIEVAKEFVEPVLGGQKFIAVTEVVFSKLSCRVALLLEQGRKRHILRPDA